MMRGYFSAILESPRSYIVLGVNVINGIEINGIKSLSDCIKKCATAGGGIASKDTNIVIEGQVCCHLDYDFSSHKCFFHPCVNMAIAQAAFCSTEDIITDAPFNAVAHPTTISITICEYYYITSLYSIISPTTVSITICEYYYITSLYSMASPIIVSITICEYYYITSLNSIVSPITVSITISCMTLRYAPKYWPVIS